ncbi:MAG: TolC family protein [Proteobacteria bacterium]|nr:TolC family protein [Pseudomonadota bacterium]
MIRVRRLTAILAVAACSARAASPLPDDATMSRALLASPAVQAARASADEADAIAQSLRTGPYEWTVRASTQRRRVDTESSYTEWDTGVERALRLPSKWRIDRSRAKLEPALAEARLAEVIRQERRLVTDRWLECIVARQHVLEATSASQESRRLRELVGARRKHGDASQVDDDMASADLAAAESEETQARLEANQALAAIRLLGIDVPEDLRHIEELPPMPVIPLVSASPATRLARLEADRADAEAQRAVADRMPDPTVSVRWSSERGGGERLATVSVAFPLPGARRAADARRAQAKSTQAASLAAATERHEQDALLVAQSQLLAAMGRGAQLEAEAAARHRVAETLTHAFELGDGDVWQIAVALREERRVWRTLLHARRDAWLAYAWLQSFGSEESSGS